MYEGDCNLESFQASVESVEAVLLKIRRRWALASLTAGCQIRLGRRWS